MKRAAVLLAALGLGACSSDGASDYSAYYRVVRQSLGATFGNGAITRAQAAAVPFASMGVRMGGSPESLIVLASDNNGDQLWTSKSHIVIMTRDGRIMRSVGLGHDLSALTAGQGGVLPAPADALKGPVVSSRGADFADIGAYGVEIRCSMTAGPAESIRILGQVIQTRRVDEDCQTPALNWKFQNRFWLDADTGFVWRSIQQLHPQGETVRTEIFRPPG